MGFTYLGGILFKAKDLDGSLAAYREALRLSEDEPAARAMARRDIGWVLHVQGHHEAALAEFQGIIESEGPRTDSAVSLAYLERGNVFLAIGRRTEAIAAWQQAAKSDRVGPIAKKARELIAANR